MVDLAEYIAISDYLADLERAGEAKGAGEAAFEWFFERQGLTRDDGDIEYVTAAVARLSGHPKGYDYDRMARREDLDRRAWTFHRAWVDRYGFYESTNEAGIAWFREH